MAGAAEPDLLPSAWQCKLPVCITLSAANISSPVSLPPLYVSAWKRQLRGLSKRGEELGHFAAEAGAVCSCFRLCVWALSCAGACS